jgi:hypothetical protein
VIVANHVIKIILLVVVSATIVGCGIIAEIEHYTFVTTDHFSHRSQNAKVALALPNSTFKSFVFKDTTMRIEPAQRLYNIQYISPFPAPGKGTDYSDNTFFMTFDFDSAPWEVLTFEPAQFVISVEGGAGSMAPERMEDCEGNEMELSKLRLDDASTCLRLYYPMKIRDVARFTLICPIINASGTLYMFPDIDYQPGTYTYWD